MVWRYRLDIAYDGSQFFGWQVQPGRRTIQGELAAMLERLGESVLPTGAGRTDAGVHALGNTAHADLTRAWEDRELTAALQSLAPADVRVTRARKVAGDFHARYQAVERCYAYALASSPEPFFRERRWNRRRLPAAGWVRRALASFAGLRDCASLARSGSESRSTRCDIRGTAWEPGGIGAVFRISADRFLYGMVRTIVGTIVRGFEKGLDPECFESALAAHRRSAAGEAAPPQGLYLTGVRYPGEPETAPGPIRTIAGLDPGDPRSRGVRV